MKTPLAINELLQKPMNRQEFLRHTAAIALFISGGSMIAQSVLRGIGQGDALLPSQSSDVVGYGVSAYGGVQQGKG